MAQPVYRLLPGADPALCCFSASTGSPDAYRYWAYPGGAFREEDLGGSMTFFLGWHDLLATVKEHRLRDEFWMGADSLALAGEVTAPGLHVAGWYDGGLQGNLDAFTALQEQGGDGARGQQRLIVGPWTHYRMGDRFIGVLWYPSNAELDIGGPVRRTQGAAAAARRLSGSGSPWCPPGIRRNPPRPLRRTPKKCGCWA